MPPGIFCSEVPPSAQAALASDLAPPDSSASFTVHTPSPPMKGILLMPNWSIWRSIGPAWGSMPP